MSNHDVIILGGGLVGMALSLALDRHGFTSAIVDPLETSTVTASGFDGRASAVASMRNAPALTRAFLDEQPSMSYKAER